MFRITFLRELESVFPSGSQFHRRNARIPHFPFGIVTVSTTASARSSRCSSASIPPERISSRLRSRVFRNSRRSFIRNVLLRRPARGGGEGGGVR